MYGLGLVQIEEAWNETFTIVFDCGVLTIDSSGIASRTVVAAKTIRGSEIRIE